MVKDNGMGGELNNLEISEEGRPLLEAVRKHIRENVIPVSDEFDRINKERKDRWVWAPRQIEIMETAKDRAKQSGLWNFFLPNSETGEGLSNLDYAYIAAELGKYPMASETLNCSAPDTGNMEVLERVGTKEQKERWLTPLLNGEIRSCYGMTEPRVSSSDARNIACEARLDGDEWVIDGEKFYISGAGDPRCKVMICMVRTDADAAPDKQQSQILIPMDTPGLIVMGPMYVFGQDDAPIGHMHIKLDNVRVPKENVLLGAGRGFEVSQLRLGPGRIHHCMRAIGQAERAFELMMKRASGREAFGKPIIKLGKNIEMASRIRIDIECMRLLVLKAARAMDVLDPREARHWIHMAKALVPEKVCRIIDQAIQIHGAAGLSQWTPLADMFIQQRTLRFADGPDEVHHMVVGRNEQMKYL